ncbi:helix-turn-helix transcriptional regulator [Halalkalibacter sp. APA_J-10(15)]|uniref:helix-turn-helix domain-containing protein n=1 Tax=unclassified Halalkalibacter TaxID=2893063 RepID=UPI001FF4F39B|nr:helix-turn-helix transcriptional regulator [Halalkalibacter sp. APA_J-10(15)]MCK0473570.1 helix-turn-helix transcriptional regulator [Halalkalibacter sp. APA_J-10(15)]
MKEKIRKLMDSDIKSYIISKETGIQQSTISRLRKGNIKIGRLTLDTALKLVEFYDQHKDKVKPPQA